MSGSPNPKLQRLLWALRHPVSQNAFALYVVQFAVSVIPLVTLPWIARRLGPHELGLVVFGQAFSWMLLLIIEFGFNASGTRAVARTRGDPAELARTTAAIQGAKLMLCVVASAVALASAFLIPIFQDHPGYLVLAWVTALFQGVDPGWFFVGIERMRFVSWLEVANRVLAGVFTILLVRGPGDGWIVLALWAAGTIVTSVVTTGLMYRHVALRSPTIAGTRWALGDSWRLFIGGTAVTLYTSANVFFLGVLSTTVQAAFYSTAEKLVRAAPRVITPIATAVFPRVGNLLAQGDHDRARQLTRLTLMALIGLSSAAAAVLIAFAEPIVHLLYGDGFDASIGILRVLALTLPLTAASSGTVQLKLIANGFDRESMIVVVIAALVNLALAFSVVPTYGAKGTAWVIVVVEAVALAAALVAGRRVRHTSRTVAS